MSGVSIPTGAWIYRTRISHSRRAQVRNDFSYSHDMWLVDVDNLPTLPAGLGSIGASDHLGDPTRSIRGNVEAFLAAEGITETPGLIRLLTTPRRMGYVFNPLSLYWCYPVAGSPAPICVIAEVHNTYRERHCYLLRPDEAGRAQTDKAFYVSPFLDAGGEYLMRLPPPTDRLNLTIALRQGERTPFSATVQGRRLPMTVARLLAGVVRRPLGTYRVSALIRWQGIRLWLRGVRIRPRGAHHPPPEVGAPDPSGRPRAGNRARSGSRPGAGNRTT